MSLEIISFFENESFTWTYLVADTLAGKAAIVDPVWVYDPVSGGVDRAFTNKVLGRASENGWQVEWVLETHAHADHLGSGALIRSETGARIAALVGVEHVAKITGADTFLVRVRVADIQALTRMLEQDFGAIPTIASTRTSLVLETVPEA